MESVFATLGKESIHQEGFLTQRQATGALPWFIEGFDDGRKHLFLGRISPAKFEERQLTYYDSVSTKSGEIQINEKKEPSPANARPVPDFSGFLR